MRTFALIGAAALAFSIATCGPVFAWSEQPVQQGNGSDQSNLANPLLSDEKLKDLESKVQSGTSSQSGFYVTGGVNQTPGSLYGFQSNPLGTAPAPFTYSPNPGFRGRD
ncbi:MAG TPA: hypothetical protein VE986_07310 [Hyphomicrobiales bacterium]|nr:hypothetical protein [Hyphomicrobiales bacterium]